MDEKPWKLETACLVRKAKIKFDIRPTTCYMYVYNTQGVEMDLSIRALNKVKKWQEQGISKYRISKELNAQWITVWRWLNGKSKPSLSFSKNILATEIEK